MPRLVTPADRPLTVTLNVRVEALQAELAKVTGRISSASREHIAYQLDQQRKREAVPS